jgi:hypothetical protein
MSVLTDYTHLIIRKHNGMSKLKMFTVNIFLFHFRRGVAGNKFKNSLKCRALHPESLTIP